MATTNEEGVAIATSGTSGATRRAMVTASGLEAACCAILAALLLQKGILPGWRMLYTDFLNYYVVAGLFREGYSLDRIYDWIWLERIKDHWGLNSMVAFAGLTPFSALALVPYSIFPAILANRLWIITNLLFLCSSIELLSRVTALGRRRIWLLALLAIFPLRTSFLYGQMHLLIFFLLVRAYYFYRKERPIACGICLAIAGLLKIYPLLLGGYFLWKRRWRPALALLFATLVLMVISYLCFGSELNRIYATQVLPRSLQGEILNPYGGASGPALFHRLFIAEPQLNPSPWLDSPSLYAVLYPLWQLAILVPLLALLRIRTNQPVTNQLEWAAFLFALLVLSPVPSSYHFVVMILSIVLLVDVLLMRRQYGVAGLAITLYTLMSIVEVLQQHFHSTNMIVTFGRLWAGLLIWPVFLFCLWPERADRKLPQPELLALCAFVVVVWTAGAFGYHRHFADLKQEASRRTATSVRSSLASGPLPTSAGWVYTALLSQGYRVLDQSGREVWNGKYNSPDQLSAAAVVKTSAALLELADGTGSRIVAMPSGTTWMANAESPALSSDGRLVAFIREAQGKGTLWIALLGPPPGRPSQLTGNAYDIRGVTFAPSGWIIFAARLNGRISVFRMMPGGQPAMVSSPGEDVDSPAISPDGGLFAFTKLVHNRWQLGYRNLLSGNERMLTRGDCNAYSPSWASPTRIAYASDCGRGLGLSALASVAISQASP